ncbi:MAG: hypothetical protein ABSC92_17030 [Rhizomicrobium sp.]
MIHRLDRQLLQEVVDRDIELPHFGIGFRLVVGEQPMDRVEGNRRRRGVEFRVLHQVQLVDHLCGQIAGREHLNLVLHGSRIGRQIRENGREVGDGVLARLQHDLRRRRIVRGDHHEH